MLLRLHAQTADNSRTNSFVCRNLSSLALFLYSSDILGPVTVGIPGRWPTGPSLRPARMSGRVQEAQFIQSGHNVFDGKVVAYTTVIMMPKLQPQLTVSSHTGQSFCL